RAGRERDAEQITRELTDPAARDTVPRSQGDHGGLQPRPERGSADLLRQRGAGLRATVPTAQLVRAMLAPPHADRRQLRDLMATEPPSRPTLILTEPAAAPTTPVRVVIDDLIHLILRPQLATRTPMPRLTACLALLASSAHQRLRLCARLRPPLRPRLRRIRRRRLGACPRVLAGLSLQPR